VPALSHFDLVPRPALSTHSRTQRPPIGQSYIGPARLPHATRDRPSRIQVTIGGLLPPLAHGSFWMQAMILPGMYPAFRSHWK
jgi:hypothetical protein